MIDKTLIESDAFKQLKGTAFKVYTFLRSKAYGDLMAASGKRIPMAYSTIVKVTGISISTVRDSIIKLENMGFIDLIEQGGLKSGGYSMNVYAISMRFKKFGTDEFENGTMKKQTGVYDFGFGRQWKNKKQV